MLLAGIILMPVSGLLGSLFNGRDVTVFGLFTIPALTKIEWLQALGHGAHSRFGKALAAVVVLHAAAALKHHFVDKATTLLRMIKGSKNGNEAGKAPARG